MKFIEEIAPESATTANIVVVVLTLLTCYGIYRNLGSLVPFGTEQSSRAIWRIAGCGIALLLLLELSRSL